MKHLLFILSTIIFINAMALPANSANTSPKSAYYRQRLSDNALSTAGKVAYIDSLVQLGADDRDNLLDEKMRLCYSIGDYEGVISASDLIGKSAQKSPINVQCHRKLILLRSLGHTLQYDRVSKAASDLYNLKKPDSLIYYNAAALEVLSTVSADFKLDKENNSISKVSEILNFINRRNFSPTAKLYATKAYLSMKCDSLEKAQNYGEALNILDQLMKIPLIPTERYSIEINLAYTYTMLGKLDIAEGVLLKLLNEPPHHRNHGMALVNYLHLLNSQHRYADAINASEKYHDATLYLDKGLGTAYLLANQAEALSGVGRDKEAYPLMARAMEITDSLRSTIGYREGTTSIRLDQTIDNINQLSEQNKNLKTLLWSVVIIATLILGAGVFSISLLRRQREMLKEAQARNVEAEKRCRSLPSNSLKLAQVNESIEHIINLCVDKSIQDAEKVNKIHKTLGNLNRDDNMWEIFRHNFEGVHSGFFSILSQRHPDLTEGEMRMCAYIMMKLSSKEIATLTNRTLRSVESMRYRINKKTGISGSDSLSGYLISLLPEKEHMHTQA